MEDGIKEKFSGKLRNGEFIEGKNFQDEDRKLIAALPLFLKQGRNKNV